MTEIGLSCILSSDRAPCRAQYSTKIRRGESYLRATDRMEREAGAKGWVIGLASSGQAYYACPDHADMLIDAMVLR